MRIPCLFGLLVAMPAPAAPLHGVYRGMPATYEMSHGRAVYQGDILLDHVAPLPAAGGHLPHSVSLAYTQYLWPKNTQGVAQIPYIITNAAGQLNTALAAFNNIFAGIIQFTPRNNEADYVNFNFDTGNSSGVCESFVGRAGNQQVVDGSANCSLGTILHEMGHVTGLFHEQSRPDRDQYLTLNLSNVIKGSEYNFEIPPYGADTLGYQDPTLFDYASVMMYIPYAFTRNGGVVLETIPPGMPLSSLTGYSASDIDGVKRLYGAAPAAVTISSNPPGLSVIVDNATVTTPQNFNWTKNSTHTLAVPSFAQTIGGVTYIYGRWNDSTAASHSIQITPGNKTLAQPANAPAVTVYSANFVRLSPYSATVSPPGSGTVSVNPLPQTYTGANGQFFVDRQTVTLTAGATGPNRFVQFEGTDAPYSANPKITIAPDDGSAFAVKADFTNLPITTITTVPGGFYFTVDGYYYKAPQNFADDRSSGWGAGSTHNVTGFTPNEPYSFNSRFIFNAWSDGGALSHTITVPAASSTVSASYTAQYLLDTAILPSCGGTLTLTPHTSDNFYTAGTKVKVKETPNSGWFMTGWTSDAKGIKPTQSVTVTDEKLLVANYNTSATAYALTAFSPGSFAAGSAGGTVKIKGRGFSAATAVFVNNTYRGAAFVNAGELDVALTATDLTAAGAFPIGVSNFPNGAPCGAFAAMPFFVTQ